SAAVSLKLLSMYPVTREFLNDIWIHGFGVVYIQFALGNRAVTLLGKPPAVQRRRQSGIDPERGVKVGDGVFRLSALQVNKPAAVQGIDKIRAQPKRLVAILQGRL